MSIDYTYDEKAATKADDAASRIAENGAYVGTFKKAWAIVSTNTGTHGITFAFESPGQGTAEFTLYTRKADGTEIFGWNLVSAIMFLLGVKKLESERGMVEVYDEDQGKRVEQEGDVFPALCDKPIGVVLQKELYTKQGGGDGTRIGLYGVYDAATKLMMSELKEKKTTPVKLERLLKGLKTKDSRKAAAAEPAHPSVGAEGGY
jgi:hypothetical protein